MEFLVNPEFWRLAGEIIAGCFIFGMGMKIKGSSIIINALKDSINEYGRSIKTRPNDEIINIANDKLPSKEKI